MGFNTTLVVYNDSLCEIRKDSEFGKKVADAIATLCIQTGNKAVDIHGSNTTVATVIESHHADSTSIVAIGGNAGTIVTQIDGWNHPQDIYQLLDTLIVNLPHSSELQSIREQLQQLKPY